ncbi:MAG: HD domain-containing protein [Bdellovibrionales bacterium]|nr:HD domain-containing protein [Bdellovibrionales bacterium]
MKQDTPQKIEETIAAMEAHPVVAAILTRLDEEVPGRYTFHSASHSRDVLREAVYFAVHDRRTPREIELIAIAAAFHDAGFIQGPVGHEARGAEDAANAMRDYGGFTEEEIAQVRQMILDTQLLDGARGPCQRASIELSGYLLDADLSNFGRDDFFTRLDAIIQEQQTDEQQLVRSTRDLMRRHTWITPAAQALRGEKKQGNIEALEAKVKG